MSDETVSVDAGLDELTTDILGPADGAETPSGTNTEGVEQEPTEEQRQTEASAQAPTAPQAVPPQLIEIDGRQYTPEQVKAAFTTREQFKHLQDKYLTAKQKAEAYDKAEAERAAQGQPVPQDPAKVKAMIRANFDPGVKELVAQGFIEPDFAELYPDFAAQAVMFRDVLTATVNKVTYGLQELERYRAEQAQFDTRSQNERIISDARNNIMSLSGEHEALKPLASPEVVEKFMDWLEKSVNPTADRLYDRDFLISQWVAFNKESYLQRAQSGVARQAEAAKARADSRRRAVGDALPGARPAASPAGPMSALEEMVEDALAFRR